MNTCKANLINKGKNQSSLFSFQHASEDGGHFYKYLLLYRNKENMYIGIANFIKNHKTYATLLNNKLY